MAWSDPYVQVPPKEANREPYYGDCLGNYTKGDKSWWQKTISKCSVCGELGLWVRRVDLDNGQSPCDWTCICDGCDTSGTIAEWW